jgi:glycosyltransferase involved in cell wall biosynthesis
MFSPDPRRFSSKIVEAAMRSVYGVRLAERRKSYFCDLLREPQIRDAEMIHAHFVGWGYMVGVPLARILGIPVTVTAHEVELPAIEPATLRYVQQHADRIVLVSTEYKEHWVRLTGSDDRLRVVHHGVELDEFPPREAYQRRPGKRIRLVSIARLVPHKRVDDGIRAVARLVERGVDAEYHVIGDGPERSALEALSSKLHLDGRVTLLGFPARSELIAELGAADVLLHPSEAESFGIAVIEGMAASLPVVVARSSGVLDIVEHECIGYLYEPGDVDALSGYVERLAQDASLRTRFAVSARARAESRFAWERHMAEMYSLWNEVLQSRPDRGSLSTHPSR